MEIHSPSQYVMDEQIKQLKEQHVKVTRARPYEEPIREFKAASNAEGMVRGWLTYSVEARKQLLKDELVFQHYPKREGEPAHNPPIAGETEEAYQDRQLERWRALCVVIQEESRPKAENRSTEVAVQALKMLFPAHSWPKVGGAK